MKSIEEQAKKFLRDKELISKGFNHFIIDFPNDKEVNLGELLAEFAEEYAKQAVNSKLKHFKDMCWEKYTDQTKSNCDLTCGRRDAYKDIHGEIKAEICYDNYQLP